MATVYLRHLRRLRYCMHGCRAFFARHGIDWARFRARGVAAETLEATGDAMACRAAAIARDDDGRQQQ